MTQTGLRPMPGLNGEPKTSPLRIVAADGDPTTCRSYREALAALGHEVCLVGDGRQLVELCRAARPDLVIAGVGLPGLSALEAAAEVWRERPTPLIAVCDPDDLDAFELSPDSPVFACLVKPVQPNSLAPAIAAAMNCFGRVRSLWEEVTQLRQALEDRKVIERAKGMVMKYAGLDEEDAFHRLRKLASNQNRKLVEVAQTVVEAGEVFRELAKYGEEKPPVASRGFDPRRGRRLSSSRSSHDATTPR